MNPHLGRLAWELRHGGRLALWGELACVRPSYRLNGLMPLERLVRMNAFLLRLYFVPVTVLMAFVAMIWLLFLLGEAMTTTAEQILARPDSQAVNVALVNSP